MQQKRRSGYQLFHERNNYLIDTTGGKHATVIALCEVNKPDRLENVTHQYKE